MSVSRCRPPLGQIMFGTLDHATCDVYLLKAFETYIGNTGKMLRTLVPLKCAKYIFFGFMEALD